MKKIKPFIKPIILLTLGITLLILFRDKYIELFSPKKEKKDFTVEYTQEYNYEDGDILYTIDEAIDSYIVISNTKVLKNFKITNNEEIVKEIDEVKENSKIALLINHKNYKSIITFDIDDKSYKINAKKKNNDLNIVVEEMQD